MSQPSSSCFRCRRFLPSDVSSLLRLLTQQRLAGAADASPQRKGKGGVEEPALSPRAAANLEHVRRWWGVDGCSAVVCLLRAQWLSLVVEDDAGLLAVAAFHTQPNVAAVRLVCGGPPLSPSQWPSWLSSFCCRSPLSPAASTVSGLQPHCTTFLSFFACATLSNQRQQREVREQLLHAAFHVSERITRIALIAPATAQEEEREGEGDRGEGAEEEDRQAAPPLRGSPLALSFRLVDDGQRSHESSASASAPLCVYLCQSEQPRIRVRRAVLEDHDDLLPLFERQTQLSAGQCGPFFLAQLVEPSSTTAQSASAAGSPPLLQLLSSSSSVPLVAEVDGRAVGLLCLTSHVDVTAVSRSFDLSAFERTWTRVAAAADGGLDAELPAISSPDKLSSRMAALFGALSAASSSWESSGAQATPTTSSASSVMASAAPVASGKGGESGGSGGGAVAADAVWQCWSGSLADALRGCEAAALSAGSAALSSWWASEGAGLWREAAASAEAFERLWREAAEVVLAGASPASSEAVSGGGSGGEVELLLQRWSAAAAARADSERPTETADAAAAAATPPLLPPSQPSPRSFPAFSSSSVVCVVCFVLDQRYASQASELFLPAFAAFPSRSFLLMSLPHSTPTFPLLHSMTQLTRRQAAAGSDGDSYPHATYLLHRATALSMQRGGAGLQVAIVSLSDEADVTRALQWATEEEQSSRLLATAEPRSSCAQRELQRWKAALRSPSSSSSASPPPMCCLTIRCAGELVGLVRAAALQSPQQLTALHAHFSLRTQPDTDTDAGEAVDPSAWPDAGEKEGEGSAVWLRHVLLNPLFAVHLPALLLEVLRVTCSARLLYALDADSASFHPLLVRHLPQCRPLQLPSPPLPQRPLDALRYPQPAPEPTEPLISSSHSPRSHSPRSHSTSTSPPSMAATSSGQQASAADAFVAPGPPLPPLACASSRRSARCVACGESPCPSFALYSASYASLSRPRVEVNSRVLIVGAGHTALAAAERLVLDPDLFFSHIHLIARTLPHNVAAASTTDEGGCSAAAVSLALQLESGFPSDLSFDAQQLRRLRLDARLGFTRGQVEDIDHSQSLIRYSAQLPHQCTRSTADTGLSQLAYDELLLATGLQPSTRHLSVVVAARTREGEAARVEGELGVRHEGGDGSQAAHQHRPSLSSNSPLEVVASTLPSSSPRPSASPSLAPVSRLRGESRGRSTSSLPPLLSPSASSSSSSRPSSAAPPQSRVRVEQVRGVHRMGSADSAQRLAVQLAQLGGQHSSSSHAAANSVAEESTRGPDERAAEMPSGLPLLLSPSLRVVVSGCSLLALSLLSALLQLGVCGESLLWLHGAGLQAAVVGGEAQQQALGSHGDGSAEPRLPCSLSAAVFGEDGSAALSAALQALAHERVRIIPATRVVSVEVLEDEASGCGGGGGGGRGGEAGVCDGVQLHSVWLSSGEVLPCDALLLCDGLHLDERLLRCIERLSLVFDGRLVVDEQCRTRLPGLRAAGPLAKFQRRLLNEADVRHPSHLHHRAYHSAAVGRLAADHLSRALLCAAMASTAPPGPALTARRSLERLRSHSCVSYARLPGVLAFLLCTTAPHSQPPAAAKEAADERELRLCQSFSSYSFDLCYSPSTLQVTRVSYWGAYEVPAVCLVRLIGLPVTYLNRLLQRWEEGQLRSLLLFLQQDWTAPLYSTAFRAQHSCSLQALSGSHLQHVQPILQQLSSALRLHSTQQPQQAAAAPSPPPRHARSLSSARPAEAATAVGGAELGAALLSLTSCAPLQLRDVAHRTLLRFLTQQRHMMPATLQAQPPFQQPQSTQATAAVALTASV